MRRATLTLLLLTLPLVRGQGQGCLLSIVGSVGALGSGAVDIVTAPVSGISNNRGLSPVADTAIHGRPPGYRSPMKAFGASLFGAAVPLLASAVVWQRTYRETPTQILTFTGVMIGPSLGHFYARKKSRAWGGIALRGALMALSLYSIRHCDFEHLI